MISSSSSDIACSFMLRARPLELAHLGTGLRHLTLKLRHECGSERRIFLMINVNFLHLHNGIAVWLKMFYFCSICAYGL